MVTALFSCHPSAKANADEMKTERYAEALGMTDLNFIYTTKRFTAFQNSPFTGSPGPESDRAWHDLLSNMSVRVSREELERGNQTSVELPDGGYMAWLGVFHELHCVVSTASHTHLCPSRSLKHACVRRCCGNGNIATTTTRT